MKKKKLGVFFGGVTVEHEVSVITGLQLMKNVNRQTYELIPIYIDKSGRWWTGEQLYSTEYFKDQDLFSPRDLSRFELRVEPDSNPIDVAILCFHGGYGESGNVQGLLELAQIPYQGPQLTSSAICFDKIFLRQVLQSEGINQPDFVWFTKTEWEANSQVVIQKIHSLEFPVFIKPANGGSSIGIEYVKTEGELSSQIEKVLQFDDRILVEAEIQDCIEVNVSVLGIEGQTQASVAEQPIKSAELLSFSDKYEKGGGKKSGMASASRRIPAPISSSLTKKVQDIAQQVFTLLDCSGVVRIDFFVDPSSETVYVVEPNTIPGSMSFYLWEASGLKYSELIDRLVEIAEQQSARQKQLIRSFTTNILQKN